MDAMERILDPFDSGELDVVQLTVHLFDPADIFVLTYVPRLRIDRDLPAGAFPAHTFHRRHEGVAIGVAAFVQLAITRADIALAHGRSQHRS